MEMEIIDYYNYPFPLHSSLFLYIFLN